MEEIREAPRCINIVPALGGGFCCSEGNYCTCGGVFKKSGDTALQAMTNQYHTALRRADMWRRRAEAAENKLQHITTPESSPAPLERQEELWDEAWNYAIGKGNEDSTLEDYFNFIKQGPFILTRRTEVSSCNSCDHKSCGYPNSDCRDSWKLESKVSPDLGKFHDLENDYRVTE